jgi:hypothetical protein
MTSRNVGNQLPTRGAVTCLKRDHLRYAAGKARNLKLFVARILQHVERERTADELKRVWKEAAVNSGSLSTFVSQNGRSTDRDFNPELL